MIDKAKEVAKLRSKFPGTRPRQGAKRKKTRKAKMKRPDNAAIYGLRRKSGDYF